MPRCEIYPTEYSTTIGGYPVTARRLWLRNVFEGISGLPMVRRCLLDPRAPLSMIPYSIWETHGLIWQATNNRTVSPGVTSWQGVPADLGLTRVWMPTNHSSPAGPFDMLAKIPERATAAELKGIDRPPVLVGLDFLAQFARSLEITWQHQPPSGTVVFS